MTKHLDFTPEIQEVLQTERYHHPSPLVQRRMEVLWLKSHDVPHAMIAKLAGVSENTMREYFRLYEEGGVDRLKEIHCYRPSSALEPYSTTLETYFRENPPSTIKEAQHKIEAVTGITQTIVPRRSLPQHVCCML